MEKNDVLVFSIALGGYAQLFHSCLQSQQEYCAKFNYDYIVIDKSPRNLLPFEAAWLKIFLLRSAMACGYKWIAFFDADCEVRLHTPSFVQDLQKYRNNKNIFMAQGFSGRINSGVIILKNSNEAFQYLEDVIQNGDIPVPNEDKALYENGHMIHFGKSNPDVQIIPSANWNNNLSLDPESYIQHYSGGKLRMKYLNARPISKYKYLILRKLINKLGRYTTQNVTTSMNEINSLLPFYQLRYPEFKSEN